MIGLLRGVVSVLPARGTGQGVDVLVEVGSEDSAVGYVVTVTAGTAAGLVSGERATLHVHHHFWEADQRLFGFLSTDERVAFVGLLGAHKVGPALALAVLSTFGPEELARVLADEDIDALCRVPGVGKKTAQRLLVDLKSSLVLPVLDTPAAAPLAAGGPLADVRDALASLGYTPEEITLAVDGLGDPSGSDTGTLLKQALRALADG